MQEFLTIALYIFVPLFCLWAGFMFGRRDKNNRYEKMTSARDYWWDLHRQEEEKNTRLLLRFEKEVESEVERRIRSWTPSLDMAKEDFALAEQMTERMRLRRKTLDGGRQFPARQDQQGESARVLRIQGRSRR